MSRIEHALGQGDSRRCRFKLAERPNLSGAVMKLLTQPPPRGFHKPGHGKTFAYMTEAQQRLASTFKRSVSQTELAEAFQIIVAEVLQNPPSPELVLPFAIRRLR